MPSQTTVSQPIRGNRTSYDGAELLMALWVLEQFAKEEDARKAEERKAGDLKKQEGKARKAEAPKAEVPESEAPKEEERGLLAKEVHQRAVEHFGSEAVPGEKKIRKCLETLVDWTGPGMAADADGAPADVSVPALCTVIPRVEKMVGKRGEARYYVYPYRNSDMEDLCRDLGVTLDLACQAEIERAAIIKELPRRRADEAGDGDGDGASAEARAARDKAAYLEGTSYFMPETGKRSMVEILAMVVTLRRAIQDKQAVSFIRAGYRPLKSSKNRPGDPYKVNGFQSFEVIKDKNRDCLCRWPHAVTYTDGQYYLLVDAKERDSADWLAPYPVAEIYELRIIDPDNPLDHNENELRGCELTKLHKRRDEYDGMVASYYDGAVLGWGASKPSSEAKEKARAEGKAEPGVAPKADIKLLCKGDGFHDAYLAFHDFEGYTVYKGDAAEYYDGIEEAERPNQKQSRKANAWYTVCFKAHPHGVEEWVKRRLRDAKILEPEKSARQIDNYLRDIRFDRWGQIDKSSEVRNADVPKGTAVIRYLTEDEEERAKESGEIEAMDRLSGREKRLLAAYRAYKARKGAGK